MAVLSTTVGTVGVIGSALYLIRRRIARGWIDCRSKECDLTGKTIVITGANVGLGLEAAKDLAKRSAQVVIACRNIEKAKEASQSIGSSLPVDVFELDLASLASVREFSSALKSKYPKIDTLICNAGVWVPMDQHAKTKDGFEIHFGVNHLGHFALIQELTGFVQDRIVIVGSGLMTSGKLDLEKKDFVRDGRQVEDEHDSKPSFAPTGYCDSKLMNALTAKHLGNEKGVTAVAVSPGFCRSSLARNMSFAWYKKATAIPIMRLIQRSTVQGAQNIVFAVIEPELKSGAVYRDGDVATKETEYVDSLGKDAPRILWELSENLVKEASP